MSSDRYENIQEDSGHREDRESYQKITMPATHAQSLSSSIVQEAVPEAEPASRTATRTRVDAVKKEKIPTADEQTAESQWCRRAI